MAPELNKTLQKLSAWAGPAFIICLLPSFWIMGFLPPVSPVLSAEEFASHLEERRTAFRFGAMIVMQTGLLMFLWVAAISAQLRRIEGDGQPILSYAQLIAGLAANFVIVLMSLLWTVVAYRPERDPHLMLLFNDLAWLTLVMPAAPLMLQAVVIGIAVFADTRRAPLFPRWLGYFNFWIALLLLPGVATTFFKTGPFAWDGLLVFWVPILAFFAWIVVMAWAVSRAVDKPDEPRL